MGFGSSFSVSDVAGASTFAWQIYKSCRDLSDDFKGLAADVANLYFTFRDTDECYHNKDLRLDHRDQLAAACRNCLSVLELIDKRLEKYNGLQNQQVWDRMRWGMEDVSVLQEKLVSSTTVLTTLNTNIAYNSQARVETMLNKLLEDTRDENGEHEQSLSSVPKARSLPIEDENAWDELKEDLEKVDINMELFIQHRKFIVQWLQTAVESGVIETEDSAGHMNTIKSLSTLIENDLDLSPLTKSSSKVTEEPSTNTPLDAEQIAKRRSDSHVLRNSKNDGNIIHTPEFEVFPKTLEQERPHNMSKKRAIFKRTLKGLSNRLSLSRDSIDSPKTPMSPRSFGRSARQSSIDATPTFMPPTPPLPLVQGKLANFPKARNRSNTSKTVIVRHSDTGGEIDLASGYSISLSRKGSQQGRRGSSTAPRPHSETLTDHTQGAADAHILEGKRDFELPPRRLSKDLFDPSTVTRLQRQSDSIMTRRPSEACSEQSTKRSSRTSAAMSPYERETFERHNAIMKKAYFERTPAHEAKMDAARRSLQVGNMANRPVTRAPVPLPAFTRLAASGMVMQVPGSEAPEPPPKDKADMRRHTQPIPPRSNSLRGLELMPSRSSLATTGSDYLTVMLPPDLVAQSPQSIYGPTDPFADANMSRILELEEKILMDELTGPLKRYSLNTIQPGGDTYLLRAAASGFSEAVLYLLQNGASVLTQNAKGQNALYAAVAANHPTTARAILDAIPAKSISELWECNVLHAAVELGSAEMVTMLLENGADKKWRDDDGRTACDIAARRDDEDLLRLILGYEAKTLEIELAEEPEEEGMKEIGKMAQGVAF